MEFLTEAWEWISNLDPYIICGILLLPIAGVFAYFFYSTILLPLRVANTVANTIPFASDIIIHRKAIQKHATEMIGEYRKKDLDEMDLTNPDEIE